MFTREEKFERPSDKGGSKLITGINVIILSRAADIDPIGNFIRGPGLEGIGLRIDLRKVLPLSYLIQIHP